MLNGKTSAKDGAHQWLVDEAIPSKHLNTIIEQQLYTLIPEGEESKQKHFGELMRYLLKERKTEFETQLLEIFRRYVINFMKYEFHSNNAPGKVWDVVAQVLCPLFSTEYCPNLPCFGPEHFNKLVKLFRYKERYLDFDLNYLDFDFTGYFAASLLRRLYEKNNSQVSNEFNIRKFWKSTDLLWINLYNDDSEHRDIYPYDSEKQFFKILGDKKLKYLYNYDLVKNSPKFKDDFDYKQLDSFLSSGFTDVDSFAQVFKDSVKLDKIYSQNNPLWNEETIISAVYIIAESIGNFYLSKAELDNVFMAAIVENSLSLMCDVDFHVDEHHDDYPNLGNLLEVEILYSAENTYSKTVDLKNGHKFSGFMDALWDGYALQKETVLEKWENEKYFSNEIGRGLSIKERTEMKLTLSAFLGKVSEYKDEDE